jgi:hypothetical protein
MLANPSGCGCGYLMSFFRSLVAQTPSGSSHHSNCFSFAYSRLTLGLIHSPEVTLFRPFTSWSPRHTRNSRSQQSVMLACNYATICGGRGGTKKATAGGRHGIKAANSSDPINPINPNNNIFISSLLCTCRICLHMTPNDHAN